MKKFSRKLITSLAAVLMAGGLVACDVNAQKEDSPELASLKAAAYYVNQIYQSDNGKTKTGDFERIAKYEDNDGHKYDIEWSLKVLTAGAPSGAVKLVAGKNHKGEDDANLALVDIDEESEMDVDFELQGVIKSGDLKVDLDPISLKMPKLRIYGWDEYVTFCKGSGSSAGDAKNHIISVEGYITALIGTANGNTTQAAYVQTENSEGAYYVYGLGSDPHADFAVGDHVRVTGETGLYSGSYEFLAPTMKKLDNEKKFFEPVNYTKKFLNAASLKDESLAGAQGLYVKINDVTITGENESSGYYNFKKGNFESYARISSSVCPISSAAIADFKASHASHLGWAADVEGIINVYDGAFYLTPINDHAFTYKSLPALGDDEAVAFELENIELPDQIDEKTVLPIQNRGLSYQDVSIIWNFKEGTSHTQAVIDAGEFTFTPSADKEETVYLVATVSRGHSVQTKEFKVKINFLSEDVFVPQQLREAPKVGVAYKYSIEQKNLGKTLYFSGAMDGNYLATTELQARATDVYLEEVKEGNNVIGYHIYFKDGDGNKKYIDLTQAKAYVQIVDKDKVESVWTFDEDAGTMFAATNNSSKNPAYLGCYSSYATISCSGTSYITGGNAKNLDVSQFPARFTTLLDAKYDTTPVGQPKVGKAYKYALAQNNLGKLLYFTGAMDGNYFGTTDKLNKAVNVFVEECTGGFHIFFYDATGAKKYMDVTTAKAYTQIVDADKVETTWVWDNNLKVFVGNTTNKGNVYLGTYNTYSTISASATSYLKASNDGISQFPLRFVSTGETNQIEGKPEVGVPYKYTIEQNAIGKVVYFDGTLSGKYLGTVEKVNKAVDVMLESVEGGYRIYFYNESYKKIYIDVKKADATLQLVESKSVESVWTWDETVGAMTTTTQKAKNEVVYLGTYKTYTTMSLSSVTYINGSNVSSIGVSQFPARFAVSTARAVKAQQVTALPNVGNAYKFTVEQNKAGKVVYFAGEMSGNYLATTEKLSKATDVYLEEVKEGDNVVGYRIYFFNKDGAKKYIDLTQKNAYVQIVDKAKVESVWQFDTATRTFFAATANSSKNPAYLGCYSSYVTISCSGTSYITGDNAKNLDVSQFPARFATVEYIDAE